MLFFSVHLFFWQLQALLNNDACCKYCRMLTARFDVTPV